MKEVKCKKKFMNIFSNSRVLIYSIYLLVSSESPDSSESSDPEHNSRSRSKQYLQAAAHLQKRFGNSIPHQHLAATLQHPFNLKHMTHDMFSTHCKYQNLIIFFCGNMNFFEKKIFISAKHRGDNNFGNMPDDESSIDVSSPREINSPSVSKLKISNIFIILLFQKQ